ncbi:MAG: DUF502 domain-containing protein [Gemmatimonadota bacterium]
MTRAKLMQRLRRYLITGLIVIAPIGVTAGVLLWLFQQLDPILGRYLTIITGRSFPGLGLVALLTIVVMVGWVSQKTLGRRALWAWNSVLDRVPLASKIHSGSSQIVRAVLERDEKLFRAVGLIEYPLLGSYALVFETAHAPDEVQEFIGSPTVSVFLPTAPNPTSGYLLFLPRDDVQRLEMTVEEGVKMVLSIGVAVPGQDGEVAV